MKSGVEQDVHHVSTELTQAHNSQKFGIQSTKSGINFQQLNCRVKCLARRSSRRPWLASKLLTLPLPFPTTQLQQVEYVVALPSPMGRNFVAFMFRFVHECRSKLFVSKSVCSGTRSYVQRPNLSIFPRVHVSEPAVLRLAKLSGAVLLSRSTAISATVPTASLRRPATR